MKRTSQAASLAHLSRQNVSIFANVSHADLEGHLPKMAQLDWKVHGQQRSKDSDDDPSVRISAVAFCSCGCDTLAVADASGQVMRSLSCCSTMDASATFCYSFSFLKLILLFSAKGLSAQPSLVTLPALTFVLLCHAIQMCSLTLLCLIASMPTSQN